MSDSSILYRKSRCAVSRRYGSTWLIFDSLTDRRIILAGTAGVIWEHLIKGATIKGIAEDMLRMYDVAR